jgi:hypothetical protein
MKKGALIGGVLGAVYTTLMIPLFDDLSSLVIVGRAIGGGIVAAGVGLVVGWLYQRGVQHQ